MGRSPYFTSFCGAIPFKVTFDTGAESTLIQHSTAVQAGLLIRPTSHCARQADGSNLKTVGETTMTLTHDNLLFTTTALVVPTLDCEMLAGVPFFLDNGIVLNLPRGTFEIRAPTIPLANHEEHPCSPTVPVPCTQSTTKNDCSPRSVC